MGLFRRTPDPDDILPGVTAVPWAALRAPDAPRLLADLVRDPDRKDLRERLSSQWGHCGLWLRPAPHAIPFLLRIAQAPDNPPGAAIALDLLEELAYGEPDREENPSLRTEVSGALEKGRPFFDELLRDGDPSTKAQAIAILAGMNGRTPRLRQMLATLEADPNLDRGNELIASALTEARHYLNDE